MKSTIATRIRGRDLRSGWQSRDPRSAERRHARQLAHADDGQEQPAGRRAHPGVAREAGAGPIENRFSGSSRRETMKALLAVVAVLLGCMPVASGQTFPSRTLALVVPFPAGGPTDTIGRIVAQRMGTALGQTVVVENVTGAGGTIAGGRVARAAPDGYTLDIGHLGTHVISGAIYELQYDVLKDFEPVAMIAANPQLIVARKSIPAKDLKELIAWVKANRDKVSVAIGG